MRISKLKVPKNLTDAVGLKEIDLSKKPLGSTVALVGRNGEGKSRILKIVEKYFEFITTTDIEFHSITHIPLTIGTNTVNGISKLKESIEAMKKQNFNNPNIHLSEQNLMPLNNQYLNEIKRIGKLYVKIVDNDDLKNIKANIANAPHLTFEQILKNVHFDNIITNPNLLTNPAQQLGVLPNEFTALNTQETVNYIGRLSTQLVTDEFNLFLENKDDLNLVKEKIIEKESHQLFSIFQKNITLFLGKHFTYQSKTSGNTLSSTLLYDNKAFNLNLFSPGQRTLFAYAILFFYLEVNSKTNINDSIIIIDEPEKHLHPEAQIKLIEAIKKIVSRSGQLWIATHSINILSILDYDEIMMVKDDGIILPSRTTPGNSFNDLMGLDRHITTLIEFINSISDWAYANFMTQCFSEPDVVFNNDTNDHQFRLFKEFLSTKQQLEILDFGAGKGRIGYTLNEDKNTKAKVRYYAFEPDKNNYDLLNKVQNLQKLYKNDSEIPDNYFDCVLLCNVLHEINPKDWIDVFKQIQRVLKSDGYLLIVEDKYLPKGEKAHEFGYLILDINHLKILFNSKEYLAFSLKEKIYDDRIVFAGFAKTQISVSIDSVINSIEALKGTSFVNIKSMRNNMKDLNQGRQYANQTQLYINSILALESLNMTNQS